MDTQMATVLLNISQCLGFLIHHRLPDLLCLQVSLCTKRLHPSLRCNGQWFYKFRAPCNSSSLYTRTLPKTYAQFALRAAAVSCVGFKQAWGGLWWKFWGMCQIVWTWWWGITMHYKCSPYLAETTDNTTASLLFQLQRCKLCQVNMLNNEI